jgi:hypothetical protein
VRNRGGGTYRRWGNAWRVGTRSHASEAGSGSELLPRSDTDPRSGMTGGVRPSAIAAGGRALGRAGPSWAVSEAAGVGGRLCGALDRESKERLRTSRTWAEHAWLKRNGRRAAAKLV